MVQYDVSDSPAFLRNAPTQGMVSDKALTHVGNHIIIHGGSRRVTFINTGKHTINIAWQIYFQN